MAWPPAAYPLGTSTGNATAAKDVHPALHNNAAQAINDIVDKINATPAGGSFQPTWVGLYPPTDVTGTTTLGVSVAQYHRIVLPCALPGLAGLTIYQGVVSGNIDVGIYADVPGAPSPGARLASAGSVPMAGLGNSFQTYNFTAPIDLSAGTVVWFAVVLTSGTATIKARTGVDTVATSRLFQCQLSASPLPASAHPTVGTSTCAFVGVPLP